MALVRWLGSVAREMERGRALMRHPQSSGVTPAQRRIQR